MPIESVSVSRIIYQAAGNPAVESTAVPGFCRACGAEGDGIPFKKWVKKTFTDWDKLFPGEIVCAACQFGFTDQNEVIQSQRTGKDKPQKTRNYSHVVTTENEYIALSKGDKRRMFDLLLANPPVVVIADSGQKHLIFKARPGFWHFEGINILPFPAELRILVEAAAEIYEAGATKAEIEAGGYTQKTFQFVGAVKIYDAEKIIAPFRGSLKLKIAVFLLQKSAEAEEVTSDEL